MTIAGICELVLETDDIGRVELWDFFRDGDGAEEGVMALGADDDGA
ncbi:MAG: hypothetical protein ACJ76D_10200 [Solirubrobacterales bacterium]